MRVSKQWWVHMSMSKNSSDTIVKRVGFSSVKSFHAIEKNGLSRNTASRTILLAFISPRECPRSAGHWSRQDGGDDWGWALETAARLRVRHVPLTIESGQNNAERRQTRSAEAGGPAMLEPGVQWGEGGDCPGKGESRKPVCQELTLCSTGGLIFLVPETISASCI